MPQPSIDTALQNINLKKIIKSIYKFENQIFNKVFVPCHCHSTLIVRHLI